MSGKPAHIRKARAQRRWMTRAEDVLWQALRNRQVAGLKFRRKAPIAGLVVDFFCPAARLVIEITGPGQHAVLLARRDAGLQASGYGVLRLSRERVTSDLDRVLAEIGAIGGRRI
ncbi:hypothetical protein BOO69_14620 [Sulfitobacter alexandrii]|uniref:DUF559 domain-containing protein n=1 Tax=Sulfitobacter alexandrii TaxID=1917485 RepID=A0A1J0WK32_9RHOB|nr:endonuclease domain-containing protein [Sulfitobacter alexandrii]APE44510.1 hypothetical protein BOO69_14620 [Sulfitobacter alexandrii]